MAGFNKVLLLGYLTRDPQLSYTLNEVAVVNFAVATNRKWVGQDGSQRITYIIFRTLYWDVKRVLSLVDG